jgi:hypothetical protein
VTDAEKVKLCDELRMVDMYALYKSQAHEINRLRYIISEQDMLHDKIFKLAVVLGWGLFILGFFMGEWL